MRLLLLLTLVLAGPVQAATLVVGNKGEDSVSLIDLASGQERKRLPTGPQPHEVAISPDGTQAAVVAYGGTTIDIFDVTRAERVRRIDLAPNRRPHGLIWLRDGRLVATAEGSQTLVVVDPGRGRVVAAIPTGQVRSHMVAVSPDLTRAYVTNMGDRSVSVVDLAAGRKLRDLPAGNEPEGLALTPDGRELWVANRAEDSVMVFDTASFESRATIAVGKMPIRIAISPDGRTAVTSDLRDGALTLIDVPGRKVARTVRVGGSAADQQVTILFDAAGKHLYVAETAAARIAEVELATGRIVRRLAAGKGSDGLAVAAVNVAGR